MKSLDNNGCFKVRFPSLRRRQPETIKDLSPNPSPQGEENWISSDYVLTMTLRFLCIFSFILFFPLPCISQGSSISLTYRVIQLGYGMSNIYDSYLSPLKYTGNNVGLHYEQMRNINLMNGNVSSQHFINANYSWSKNNSGTASYYTGLLEYNYGLLYRLKPAEKWQVFTGMQAG